MNNDNDRPGVTINLTGPALTQLISLAGGDRFILDLREAVISNVIAKRVKGMITEALDKSIDQKIKTEFERSIGMVTSGWSGKTATLAPELIAKVESQVKASTASARSDLIQRIELTAAAEADRLLNELMPEIEKRIETSLSRKFDRKLEEIIDARFKERVRSALGV